MGIKPNTEVLAINPSQSGESTEPTSEPETLGSGVAREYNSDEARRCGERVCERTARQWAIEQNKDPIASSPSALNAAGKTAVGIAEGSL